MPESDFIIPDLPLDRAELLTDERGVYGVAIEVPRFHGVPGAREVHRTEITYRPDRLPNSNSIWCNSILQPIPAISREWRRCGEYWIADHLLEAMLRRDGLER